MTQSPNNPWPDRENPYAPSRGPQDPNFGYEAWQRGPEGGPSLSVLALLSLIFSLTCLLSPLGVLTGAAAIVGIQLANGRKYGRGLAIAGIVIGLIASALLVGVLVGGFSLGQSYVRNVVGSGERLVRTVEQRDWRTFRAQLEPATDQQLSDAQLDAFADALAASMGTYQAVETQNWNFSPDTSGSGFNLENVAPLPFPARFANGRAMIILVLAPNDWGDVLIKGRPIEKRLINLIIMPNGKPPLFLNQTGVRLTAPKLPPALPAAVPSATVSPTPVATPPATTPADAPAPGAR